MEQIEAAWNLVRQCDRRYGPYLMTLKRARAHARITVQNAERKSYDQIASPELAELRLTETFRGDLEGESTVRALQVLRDDNSSWLVSM